MSNRWLKYPLQTKKRGFELTSLTHKTKHPQATPMRKVHVFTSCVAGHINRSADTLAHLSARNGRLVLLPNPRSMWLQMGRPPDPQRVNQETSAVLSVLQVLSPNREAQSRWLPLAFCCNPAGFRQKNNKCPHGPVFVHGDP